MSKLTIRTNDDFLNGEQSFSHKKAGAQVVSHNPVFSSSSEFIKGAKYIGSYLQENLFFFFFYQVLQVSSAGSPLKGFLAVRKGHSIRYCHTRGLFSLEVCILKSPCF